MHATRRRFVQGSRTWYVPLAPSHEREQNVSQGPSLLAKRIGASNRTLLVHGTHDNPGIRQSLQAIGEDVGRDSLGRIQQLPVGAFAVQQVANDQQRPFVANHVERACNGTLEFLALYAHGVLPGIFALPAGLGDIAIGVTAPWLMVALIRRPSFAASKTFVVWNALGVLDLVVAVVTGALGSGLATGIAGEITTGPMALLPLVIIPAYLVPVFLMLHASALLQARRVAGNPGERA